jgi:hypothetical protein
LQALLSCCCGVDVHDEVIETCIIKGFGDEPEIIRKQFKTKPVDLEDFTSHLMKHDCFNTAMESTGVFWRPVYEAIEDHCERFDKIVVTNAAQMKNVSGRKSDVGDAEWIATLLQHGLLKSSFVPERVFRNLREASRLYKKFVGEQSRYTNRIMKLLQAHGFKLNHVLSDILGVSGRNILTILADRGSLSVSDVASCLRGRTKHNPAAIHAAVSGSLNPDEQQILSILLEKIDAAERDKHKITSLMYLMIQPYQRVVDIVDSVPGFDILASAILLAEISATPHLSFDSAQKLCSWAGLSPRNDESVGKVESRKILPGSPYVKSILCQAAWAAVKSRNNPFRDWFWANKRKLGEKKAIIAVSRKLLKTIYFLIKDDVLYCPVTAAANRR